VTAQRVDQDGGEGSRAVTRSIFAFRRNLVLAASAGTGKTHALVGVAVHLLVGACKADGGGLRSPVPPDALVATTFSRKAAAEIRVRLTGEIEKLAAGDPTAAYREDLLAAFAARGSDDVSELQLIDRAHAALGRLGRARIGTLHSFAASLVRTHALVLGLSPDFDLLDQETTRERSLATIERVLEQRSADTHLAPVIDLAGGAVRFIELSDRVLARIADDGRGASNLALAEGDAVQVDAHFRALIQHARDLLGDPRLGTPAEVVLAALETGGEERLEDAVAQLCAVSSTTKRSPAAEAFFDYRNALAGTTNVDRGRRLVRAWRMRDHLRPRAEALKAFLVACDGELARENARDSVMGFADVLRAARDLLRDHVAVAVEAGRDLEALLVDEFQDTSGVQRDLVHLLWERHADGAQVRLAGTIPGASDLRGKGLLVVGDRKQSIYGFRGADAAIFAELCVGLAGAPAREALAIPRGVVREPQRPSADFISLRHNRRAEPELLEFANAWSRLALVPEGRPSELYEIDYVSATEDLLPVARTPAARAEPRTRWLRLPVPSGKRSSDRLHEAEVIAARIDAIVRGGELRVRGAPAQWRDVAILGETHDALEAAAYMLARAEIPHVVAGMGFYGAREVRDLVSMLGCLVDPDDSLALVEVLRGPWAGASDRTLVALTDRHRGLADVSRWGVGERRHLMLPEDRPAVLALAEVIAELRPVIGRVGPGWTLREAVRALSLEETLVLLSRGEQRIANVRKVLAMADATSDPWLLHRRLRAATAAEQREGEAATFSDEDDAVRLLTVHASKGLAFPIVFLPGAGAAASPRPRDPVIVQTGTAGRPTTLVLSVMDELGGAHETPSYASVKRDLRRRDAAERQRQRYVAITRAAEAMFFVGDRAPSKVTSATYERSTAGLLARLAEDDASCRASQLVVETSEPGRAGSSSPPRSRR
jgi:ATP-dependent helicase/nuclease subunit A